MLDDDPTLQCECKYDDKNLSLMKESNPREPLMLKGKRVNLRIAEREDIPLLAQWFNDEEFHGEHQDFPTQVSVAQLEKRIVEPRIPELEWVDFVIEKKDGTKIGWATHYVGSANFGWIEIGYSLIASERRKGYGTEAIQILVNYLFLTRDIARIQAVCNVANAGSQKALEKAGFQKEGTLRRALFVRGKRTDGYMYSVLRDEWKKPNTL